MTDEQFNQLRSLIMMISDRVDQLEMHLRRQDEAAEHRFSLVYDWCAPGDYKQAVEGNISLPQEQLVEFLSRAR